MEVESKVELVIVRYYCDQPYCDGNVENNGDMLLSNPPKFIHRCKSCGDEYYLRRKYPHKAYKTID